MKTIIIYGQYMRGLEQALYKLGLRVIALPKQVNRETLEENLQKKEIVGLFSFDFEPSLGEICIKNGKKYIAWVVDWPHSHIYAKSARHKDVYIFIFDRTGYYEALDKGLENVYYLPLATDWKYFDEVLGKATDAEKQRFQCDVSFMGNLYDAKENNLYDQIEYLPPLVKGYLEGLMSAQRKVWGYTFVKEAIRQEIWDLIKQYIQWDLGDKYDDVYEELIEGMLCKKIAQMERMDMCSLLAEQFDFSLYTKSDTTFDVNIQNKGPVDYFNEMPILFHKSKININITLHSIKSGIPLRCLDIMACRGFLLSNYQEELAEYFEDGVELVLWHDFADLQNKIVYYLEHEEERERIAEAGYRKVKEIFSFDYLARRMMGCVMQGEDI